MERNVLNIIKKTYFLCLFLFTTFTLLPQEIDDIEEIIIPEELPIIDINPNVIFVINDIDFKIKGRTRPYALIRYCDFNLGEEIHGLEKLEKYIRDKTQLLINQRVLSTAKIDYAIGSIIDALGLVTWIIVGLKTLDD